MVDKKGIDVSGYQVIVEKPIWLSSRIWEPKLYENPPKILLECARSCFGDDGAVVHFAKNGVRANPFAKATMVELDTVDEDDDNDDLTSGAFGDGDGDDDKDGSGGDKTSNTNEIMFMSPADFSALSKSEQYEYIESIRNAPEDYDDDATAEYEIALKPMLEEYLKVATGVKAKEVIEEVLAEYED